MIVRPLTEYCTLNIGQSPDSKTSNTQGNGLKVMLILAKRTP